MMLGKSLHLFLLPFPQLSTGTAPPLWTVEASSHPVVMSGDLCRWTVCTFSLRVLPCPIWVGPRVLWVNVHRIRYWTFLPWGWCWLALGLSLALVALGGVEHIAGSVAILSPLLTQAQLPAGRFNLVLDQPLNYFCVLYLPLQEWRGPSPLSGLLLEMRW